MYVHKVMCYFSCLATRAVKNSAKGIGRGFQTLYVYHALFIGLYMCIMLYSLDFKGYSSGHFFLQTLALGASHRVYLNVVVYNPAFIYIWLLSKPLLNCFDILFAYLCRKYCPFHQVIFIWLSRAKGDDCERDKSRIVRNVISNELLQHFKTIGTKVPYKCPFFKDRDKYLAHEEHKERDASTQWSCGYCGKSFIGEIYLDMHLSNRHQNTIYNLNDSVCLADYCEIFRCDVLSGVATATFWDVALCMEEDMQDLTTDCEDLMRSCVPESLNWNSSKALQGSLSKTVCSYLQCKSFYEAPSIEEKEPPGTGYIVGTVTLSIFMILYYCVAVNYFWLDTFSDVYDSDDHVTRQYNSLFDSEQKQKHKPHSRPHSRKKHNAIQAEASTRQDIFQVHSGLDTSIQNVNIDEHG